MKPRVAVIGGGLAGITAALRLADSGHEVVLLEAKPKLGGLTHSFARGELQVDNGQHVFLRCCTAYLELLDRLGVTDKVTLQSRLEIPVRAPGQASASMITRNGLPAPLHLGQSLLRYSPLPLGDRLRAIRSVLGLRALDLNDPRVDEQNFGRWLADHGQSETAMAVLWDLFTVATLNAPASEASLALAGKVFQTGLFTDASAGDIGWSRVGLGELHGDAGLAALTNAGVTVRTKAKVDAIEGLDGGFVVAERDAAPLTVDQIVLATPPETTERLLPSGALTLEPGWSNLLGSAPIVNVHVVFDRTVLAEPFCAGVRTPVQWVFDRTEQSGLNRLRDGQYLAVSLSAADDIIDVSTADLRETILPALVSLLPAARSATVTDFFVTRERNATFRPSPGSARYRPSSTTRIPGLALAGAWTATGWPATMESAVLSGVAAADELARTKFPSKKGSVAA